MTFYAEWSGYAETVADRVAPLVKKWGWDRDDCRQHAAMTLWTLSIPAHVANGPVKVVQSYLFRTIQRSITRAARRHKITVTDADLTLAEVPARPTRSFAEKLEKCLTQYPPDDMRVENYIRRRVLYQESAFTFQATCPWTPREMAVVRDEAARWIMTQIEDGRLS